MTLNERINGITNQLQTLQSEELVAAVECTLERELAKQSPWNREELTPELKANLEAGVQDLNAGNTVTLDEAMARMQQKIERWKENEG